MGTDGPIDCALCSSVHHVTECSCGEHFCHQCFTRKHLRRNPTHRKVNKETEYAWNFISGKVGDISGKVSDFAGKVRNTLTRANEFKKDEAAKWFGLHVSKRHPVVITKLIETPRFSSLMEESLHSSSGSPRRQFPSICSFVGFTGAGKSTLIRSLIFHSKRAIQFEHLDVPVSGAQSGHSAVLSTTGEVNLYLDPDTFGTTTPTFYADCEGMLGTEPDAVEHQKDWSKHARRSYLVEAKTKDGRPMDRRSAVESLYPQFLYIFSDVICYVTRNEKLWADAAFRLLEWSKVGAQSTINQHVLPALIIILNAPSMENEAWVSDDHDSVTRDFFQAIDKEISENSQIREMARNHGEKSMRNLFSRCFSSVHVHYIPLEGFKSLGTSEEIIKQTGRLAKRIRDDSEKIQALKSETLTRFDNKQLSMVVDHAFSHLAMGTSGPFDFGQCRVQMPLGDTTEKNLSEFLGYCLNEDMATKFDATSIAVGICLLRHSISSDSRASVLHPSFIFSKNAQNLCKRAISHFLDNNARCAFVDPDEGERCVNTKLGHAIGHQSESGALLKPGLFQETEFDQDRFLNIIQETIRLNITILNDLDTSHSTQIEWCRYTAQEQAKSIAKLRDLGGFPSVCVENNRVVTKNDVGSSNMCYGCIFGRAEYKLPCNHVICESCLKAFDNGQIGQQYPGRFYHTKCSICGDDRRNQGWPFTCQARPDLGGIRVLSLDGGGVRGIVELNVLQRLEEKIGLGIPLGSFFDIIVGTSAGGIIALGLGVQSRPVSDCIELFRNICETGFEAKPLTKSSVLGWLARYIANSIYKTEPMECALRLAFNSNNIPNSPVFGLRTSCRVAVTTTVDDDCHLIANYNRGGTGTYLNSDLLPWKAARCTSAAPLYFEPAIHCGVECRDGGLKENNPVHLAVAEAKGIWGETVSIDTIVSVGSGQAKIPQKRPTSWAIIPDWLGNLLTTLISTMNGEEAWLRYRKGQDTHTIDRSVRLNVKLDLHSEPELDDVFSVDNLEEEAARYRFPYVEARVLKNSPVSGNVTVDMLGVLADRLRASMFFFHMTDFSICDGVAVIRGYICCRLGPRDPGFKELLHLTKAFIIKNEYRTLETRNHRQKFLNPVTFNQQKFDEPIRIDTNFGRSHSASISGFPMTAATLKEHWEQHPDTFSPKATELDSPPSLPGPDSLNPEDSTMSKPPVELPGRDVALTETKAQAVQAPAPPTKPAVALKNLSKSMRKELIYNLVSSNTSVADVDKALDGGIDIDVKSNGWTALCLAAKAGNKDVVTHLISRGAALDVRVDVGWGIFPGDGNAVNWAAEGGHLDIVIMLVTAGAKPDIDAEKPLFKGIGGTPIVMAAGNDHVDVVQYLLRVGADRNSAEGFPGWDAFLWACQRGSMGVVRHLIMKEGFSVTRKNKEGQEPIHLAVQGGSKTIQVMELLHDKGADLDAVDSNGYTALHYAAYYEQTESAVWLRRNGASLHARTNAHDTPLEVAEKEYGKNSRSRATLFQVLDPKRSIPSQF